MFRTVKRIIDWTQEYKPQLYLGFLLTFFVYMANAAPIMISAYVLTKVIEAYQLGVGFDSSLILYSFIAILLSVIVKFILMYVKAKLQEPIGYRMVAKNRLEVGEALKRVSLGYFSEMNTGSILNSITTGLNVLEKMGIRTIDTYVGGYINFVVIFIYFCCINFKLALICLVSVLISLFFLLMISKASARNSQKQTQSNRDLTKATLEYARGLPIVKSFGQSGVSFETIKKAIVQSKNIHRKIEWEFIPRDCMHLLALKFGSILFAGFTCVLGFTGKIDLLNMIAFVMFSFIIFATIEPIGDSAHLLSIIDDAMSQLDSIKNQQCLDSDGKDIPLTKHDIEFKHVDFGYTSKKVLKDVSFKIPEKTTTAIVGSSGSGKSTICNLMARFYDVDAGQIIIGGHDIRELTCDSLLKNISMVFQNVYLFNDTIRANICFAKPDATEEEMIVAAKKACCHDFIMKLPKGYDTVAGEGGSSLSGGEKQRISIARAIIKNAPIILLDEATASVDPENEQYIQYAISELTKDKTIVSIAHRLATIQNADQILVVDDGKIVQCGKHEQLVQEEGKYLQFMKARELAEGWNLL